MSMSFRISSRTDTIRYNRFAVWVTGWFARFLVSAVSRGIGVGSRSFSRSISVLNMRSSLSCYSFVSVSTIFDQDSLLFTRAEVACVNDTRKVINLSFVVVFVQSPERTILLLK